MCLRDQIIIDSVVKLNSYPSSFNLYVNGVKACTIGTVQDASIVTFRRSFIVILCLNMRYLSFRLFL